MSPFAASTLSVFFLASASMPASDAAPPAKVARFKCTPRHLRDGDVLTIRISTPHGGDLAIWDPDHRFFFLVYEPDSSRPRPLVDPKQFETMSEIRLNTREAKAPILFEGWEAPTRIFTKSGKYHVVLSTSLETENTEETFNECTVIFKGRQK
jgi:hypothetical protein